MRLFVLFLIGKCLCLWFMDSAAARETTNSAKNNEIVSPEVIENSPVLQQWLKKVPNVLEEIKHDRAFVTRFRVGYVNFPNIEDEAGLNIGIEDIFIGRTRLTISTDYQTAFAGDRNSFSANLHYFVLPLGSYFNFAPLVGYSYVQHDDFSTNGVNLGVRLMLSFSRTGAGDISVSQSLINPGGGEEVGITSLSVGYALTSHLRLSGDLERQNSIEDKSDRLGINLEWLFY